MIGHPGRQQRRNDDPRRGRLVRRKMPVAMPRAKKGERTPKAIAHEVNEMKRVVSALLALTPLLATGAYAGCREGETGYVQGLSASTNMNPSFSFSGDKDNWIPIDSSVWPYVYSDLLQAKASRLKVRTRACNGNYVRLLQFDVHD